MCYTGKCMFENHVGDCTIINFKAVEKELIHPACFWGGIPECDENYEKYLTMVLEGTVEKAITAILEKHVR